MTDIGKEYAEALFMLACERKAKSEYARALDILTTAFEESPEYLDFLSSPGISLGDRLSAVETAFAEKIPEDVLSYLCLLCEKGRISCFNESCEHFKALLGASERVSNAVVTSVIELNDTEKKALREKLEKMCSVSVKIEYRIDPSILGGVVVEIDGKIIDGSLRSRLNSVKDVIRT